jgi:hypothetical protein
VSDEGEKKLFGIKPLWVGLAAVLIVLIAVGGYFVLQKETAAHKGAAAGTTQSADAEPAPGGT